MTALVVTSLSYYMQEHKVLISASEGRCHISTVCFSGKPLHKMLYSLIRGCSGNFGDETHKFLH